MRRLLKSRLAWTGMLAMLVGLAMIVRDVGMTERRLAPGTLVFAAFIVIAGVIALAVSHVRTTRTSATTHH